MSAAVTQDPSGQAAPAGPITGTRRDTASSLRRRAAGLPSLAGPTAFAVANAIAFVILRPGVNDLWAARARASAVRHGVGLFYWFSWFGGGAAPGNYSVITPYLSAWLGTEVLGALAAVAVAVLVTAATRRTARPALAAFAGSLGAVANLWSGRVPFLLGAVFGLGAILAVTRGRRVTAATGAALGVLASPVVGTFLLLGLSGTFLCSRTRRYRPIIAWVAVPTVLLIGAAGLVFGAPGTEPFSAALAFEMLGGLALLLLARPPEYVRVTIWISAVAVVLLATIPNGLGSNISRFVWFCLPVLVLAVAPPPRPWLIGASAKRRLTAFPGRRRMIAASASRRMIAVAVVPMLAAGVAATVHDLANAHEPVSHSHYYRPLVAELSTISDLDAYRVEVVDHGAHAGYDALLGHAALARGWETQADQVLDAPVRQDPIDPGAYRTWLDQNAVGYVAVPKTSVGSRSPEYTFVVGPTATYLRPIWRDAHWRLFRVRAADPIIARPGRVAATSQSTMTVTVPCRCSLDLRLRYSRYLTAVLQPADQHPSRPRSGSSSAAPAVFAKVTEDGTGWSTLTTPRPGRYVLQGSARGLFR